MFKSKNDCSLEVRNCVRGGAGHVHEGEDELYYILSGRAETNDNGTVRELVPGDSTLTRSGEGHSIKAVGTENLELLATIVAHS